MTGADLIRLLLDTEVKSPGSINHPVMLQPHGRGYTQPLGHVYTLPTSRIHCPVIVLESERD